MVCDIKTKVAQIANDILIERISNRFVDHSLKEKYFLDFMIENHGAKLIKEYFKDQNGVVHRCGRLVNFVDDISEMSLPIIEDWEGGWEDLRLRYSVYCLESIANIGDGMGDYIRPIGILYTGNHHPDEEVTQHSDMLAFDMTKPGYPKVIIWHNDNAIKEYYQAKKNELEMDMNKFTTPVAENFEKFIGMLY